MVVGVSTVMLFTVCCVLNLKSLSNSVKLPHNGVKLYIQGKAYGLNSPEFYYLVVRVPEYIAVSLLGVSGDEVLL